MRQQELLARLYFPSLTSQPALDRRSRSLLGAVTRSNAHNLSRKPQGFSKTRPLPIRACWARPQCSRGFQAQRHPEPRAGWPSTSTVLTAQTRAEISGCRPLIASGRRRGRPTCAVRGTCCRCRNRVLRPTGRPFVPLCAELPHPAWTASHWRPMQTTFVPNGRPAFGVSRTQTRFID